MLPSSPPGGLTFYPRRFFGSVFAASCSTNHSIYEVMLRFCWSARFQATLNSGVTTMLIVVFTGFDSIRYPLQNKDIFIIVAAMVIRPKAFKFIFEPTPEQRHQLAVEFGNARFGGTAAWNCAARHGKNAKNAITTSRSISR
ncbi:MAG: helix-turn-helix domain-containing protein [Candidatus Competibacteraceae bacterium]|nr:helix-turn-helix domain-containing protein [Candidatus Competibacteraceae bacterium]